MTTDKKPSSLSDVIKDDDAQQEDGHHSATAEDVAVSSSTTAESLTAGPTQPNAQDTLTETPHDASSPFYFREATLADRDEILGDLSNNIYGGHDYLPCFYQRWIFDQRHQMICGVEKETERLVSLDTIGTFDFGATVVFQALRVHEDFRGRGLAKLMASHLDHIIRTAPCYSGTKRYRICTQDKNPASIRLHQKQGYRILTTMGFAMAQIRRPVTTPGSPAVSHFHGLRRVDSQELWAYVQKLKLTRSEDSVERLIPGNVILVDWMPYDFSERNLAMMERDEEMSFVVLLDEEKMLQGFSVFQRSQRLSGVHMFNTTLCNGVESAFSQLARYGLATMCHGCSHYCISYDTSFRRSLDQSYAAMDPKPPRDFRLPDVIRRLEEEAAGHLDFAADYVGGSEVVMEKILREAI